MSEQKPPNERDKARKAFNREYNDVWGEIAGDVGKIKTAKAILARCDRIRDRLQEHYGRRRETLIARETARLLAQRANPAPALTPDGASTSRRDIENEAIRRVADRQRAKLRSLNDRERRMIYRRVLGREPGPKRRPAKSRGYQISEKHARILDAVDRAKALRDKSRQHFKATRDQRIARAAQRGAQDPVGDVQMAEVKRQRWIDRAERNVISQTINPIPFNRAARGRSGPSGPSMSN